MTKFSVYKWNASILESQSNFVEKNIQDVTWEDVAGLSVPTLRFGEKSVMNNSPTFDDQWRQETLDSWKNSISSKYPNAVVVIDKVKDYVKIQDSDYEKDIEFQGKNRQSDYEKSRKQY